MQNPGEQSERPECRLVQDIKGNNLGLTVRAEGQGYLLFFF